jgi:hypothetical protein
MVEPPLSLETVVLGGLPGPAACAVSVGFLVPFGCGLADLLEAIVLGLLGHKRWIGFLDIGDHRIDFLLLPDWKKRTPESRPAIRMLP